MGKGVPTAAVQKPRRSSDPGTEFGLWPGRARQDGACAGRRTSRAFLKTDWKIEQGTLRRATHRRGASSLLGYDADEIARLHEEDRMSALQGTRVVELGNESIAWAGKPWGTWART